MTEKLPRYINRDKNRDGSPRLVFRRPGFVRVRIYAEPFTDRFWEEYRAAMRGEPLPVPGRPGDGLVYFILSGKDRVKIGFTTDLKGRLPRLKTGSATRLRVYYTTPGSGRLERRLHQEFSADRLDGEWFLFSPAIRDWIAADETRRIEENRRALRRGRKPSVSGEQNGPKLPHIDQGCSFELPHTNTTH